MLHLSLSALSLALSQTWHRTLFGASIFVSAGRELALYERALIRSLLKLPRYMLNCPEILHVRVTWLASWAPRDPVQSSVPLNWAGQAFLGVALEAIFSVYFELCFCFLESHSYYLFLA